MSETLFGRPLLSGFWLSFSFISGPVIWFFHFVLIWAIGEMGCMAGLDQWLTLGVNAVPALVVLATIPAVALTLFSLFIAYRNWRRLREVDDEVQTNTEGRQRFMAFAGIVLSALFTVVMLVELIPTLILPPCVGVSG